MSEISVSSGRGDLGDSGGPGRAVARVARADRGFLTVLAVEGERRVRWGGSPSEPAPAMGDRIVVQGERAVRVLPRRTSFLRTAPPGTAGTAASLTA